MSELACERDKRQREKERKRERKRAKGTQRSLNLTVIGISKPREATSVATRILERANGENQLTKHNE